jgi:hypothetical protein
LGISTLHLRYSTYGLAGALQLALKAQTIPRHGTSVQRQENWPGAVSKIMDTLGSGAKVVISSQQDAGQPRGPSRSKLEGQEKANHQHSRQCHLSGFGQQGKLGVVAGLDR